MDRSGCLKRRGSSEIMQFPTSFPGTYMSITEQCRRFTGGPPCEVCLIFKLELILNLVVYMFLENLNDYVRVFI